MIFCHIDSCFCRRKWNLFSTRKFIKKYRRREKGLRYSKVEGFLGGEGQGRELSSVLNLSEEESLRGKVSNDFLIQEKVEEEKLLSPNSLKAEGGALSENEEKERNESFIENGFSKAVLREMVRELSKEVQSSEKSLIFGQIERVKEAKKRYRYFRGGYFWKIYMQFLNRFYVSA